MEDAINKLAVGGNKEKKMIIRKPSIKMVGEEDNKKPIILITEGQYKENDLILDFMLQDEDDVKSKDNEDEVTVDDDDDSAWLNALGEEE